MKKNLSTFTVLVIFASMIMSACGGEKTPKIDFSRITEIKTDAAMFGTVEAYAFDTISAVMLDNSDFLGHYTEPVKILLYVSKTKQVRYECTVPCYFGITRKSGVIEQPTLTSASFTLSENDGSKAVKLGGEEVVVVIGDGVFLIFKNKTTAKKVTNKLNGWQKSVEIEVKKENRQKQKQENKPKGSTQV